MKRLMAFMLAMISVLALGGCNNTKQEQNEKQEQVLTYSFHGSNEYLAIINGSIVLSDTEELFDGGNLEITQSDICEDVTSYFTTFYTHVNGKREIIVL